MQAQFLVPTVTQTYTVCRWQTAAGQSWTCVTSLVINSRVQAVSPRASLCCRQRYSCPWVCYRCLSCCHCWILQCCCDGQPTGKSGQRGCRAQHSLQSKCESCCVNRLKPLTTGLPNLLHCHVPLLAEQPQECRPFDIVHSWPSHNAVSLFPGEHLSPGCECMLDSCSLLLCRAESSCPE